MRHRRAYLKCDTRVASWGHARTDAPVRALPPSRDDVVLRESLGATGDAVRGRREQELVYLANLLVASALGLSPVEAAQRTVGAVTAGLEHLLAQGHSQEDVMTRFGADQLFRIGWALGKVAPSDARC